MPFTTTVFNEITVQSIIKVIAEKYKYLEFLMTYKKGYSHE